MNEDFNWGKDNVLKLPKKVQEQGLLYNPINQIVLDENRLKKYENKIESTKKRYKKKQDIENYYQSIKESFKKHSMINST